MKIFLSLIVSVIACFVAFVLSWIILGIAIIVIGSLVLNGKPIYGFMTALIPSAIIGIFVGKIVFNSIARKNCKAMHELE